MHIAPFLPSRFPFLPSSRRFLLLLLFLVLPALSVMSCPSCRCVDGGADLLSQRVCVYVCGCVCVRIIHDMLAPLFTYGHAHGHDVGFLFELNIIVNQNAIMLQ